MPSAAERAALLARSRFIDPEATEQALAELPAGPGREVATLLWVAYPALRPRTDWQMAAIEELARSGWRARHTRSDMLERIRAAISAPEDGEAVRRALRRATWAEKARIALREALPLDQGGAELRVTARELSELADAAFEVALEEASRHVAERYGQPLRSDGSPSRMVVFGLGKLGGLELNAGSDVDVLFLYDTDEGGGRLSLHDHWTRVAQRVVASIEDLTADGSVWRVDLRLRPEGSQGALVNSWSAAERYYVTWGRLWERSAMLRARPMAGALGLGQRFRQEVIQPFVYRREVEPAIATTLAELVERSRIEAGSDPRRDLKLGQGGIREAEFFVQALQLIWGGREPTLRVTGMLLALARLRASGLVSDFEATRIGQAYVLFRRVEHCVQWATGLQTHSVPEPGPVLERVARTLGYESSERLASALAAGRRSVRMLFGALLPAAPHPPSPYAPLLHALAEGDAAAVGRYVAEQFGSADIGEHLAALARRPDGLLGEMTRERFPGLADELLDAIRESSDPELAAQQLREFFGRFGRFGSPWPYVQVVGENARVLRRFVTALGASVFVGEAIINHPDLADLLLFDTGGPIDPEAIVREELRGAFEGMAPDADLEERRERWLTGTRRAKRRVMIEVAVRDLAGVLRTREATQLLSCLADEILHQAVHFELGDSRGLAVIALGKLGGREIGYGSDLDVLFVFDPNAAPHPDEAAHHFSRVAQRIIRLVSEVHPAGPGYELDMRLRPSGAAGTLVTTVEAFARYHGLMETEGRPSVVSSGAAWERQVLLRARYCGGDRELGRALEAVAHQAAYEGGAPPVEEMHRLRLRMQRELGRERAGRYHVKMGRGGLVDIEFAVQWLQMKHGHDFRVRTTDTAEALEALRAAGYLDRLAYETFRDAYGFLRRLEQRLHVLRGRSDSVLDAHLPGLPQLARRMSMQAENHRSAAEALLARYRSVTEDVRATYLRVLGIPPENGADAARG